ncbi:hypothetical protein WA1_07345 [Scytonema hofmannii PCC 7110]|uniref:Uncharacterized protein n=1 Tax=Scytonema hofmannii PCC 7110 TaxID=128403 RepID=A0A139WT55_9CYAN|nr:hypothetical protein WA1_07345 [Scytonema hofmannii PCC 7110]
MTSKSPTFKYGVNNHKTYAKPPFLQPFSGKQTTDVGAQGLAPLHVYFGFGIIYFLVFSKQTIDVGCARHCTTTNDVVHLGENCYKGGWGDRQRVTLPKSLEIA